jgi:hypothetical protein
LRRRQNLLQRTPAGGDVTEIAYIDESYDETTFAMSALVVDVRR